MPSPKKTTHAPKPAQTEPSWFKGTLAGVLLAIAGGGTLATVIERKPELTICSEAVKVATDDKLNEAATPERNRRVADAAAAKAEECFRRKW